MQEGLHTQTSTHATSWWWSKGSSKDLFCIFMFLSTFEELEQGLLYSPRTEARIHPSSLFGVCRREVDELESDDEGGKRLRRMARLELDWFACTPLPRRLLHPAISCTWLLLDFLKKSEIFSLILLALFAWVIGLSTLYQAACLPSPSSPAAVAAAVL